MLQDESYIDSVTALPIIACQQADYFMAGSFMCFEASHKFWLGISRILTLILHFKNMTWHKSLWVGTQLRPRTDIYFLRASFQKSIVVLLLLAILFTVKRKLPGICYPQHFHVMCILECAHLEKKWSDQTEDPTYVSMPFDPKTNG